MARYVILSFEDNDDAEKFSKMSGSPLMHSGVVVGLFAQPTQFCPESGAGGCNQSKRYRSWVQGEKYGWWICAVCHKPTSKGGPEKLMRAVVAQGTNLLTVSTPSEEETPSEQSTQTTGRENALSVFDEGVGAYAR